MTYVYEGQNIFQGYIPVPEDSDPRSYTSVTGGFEVLMDRTEHLRQQFQTFALSSISVTGSNEVAKLAECESHTWNADVRGDGLVLDVITLGLWDVVEVDVKFSANKAYGYLTPGDFRVIGRRYAPGGYNDGVALYQYAADVHVYDLPEAPEGKLYDPLLYRFGLPIHLTGAIGGNVTKYNVGPHRISLLFRSEKDLHFEMWGPWSCVTKIWHPSIGF